jgi:hypothetical protein
MKKYFYLLTFILFLVLFYLLVKYYKKQHLINNIIKEWKNQTNGNIFKDTGGYIWKNDYYLMFNNYNDYSSHVHLKVFNNDFWVFKNFFKIFESEYTPKKNNNYPLGIKYDNKEFVKSYTIDESISSNKIVKQMIETYTNF